MGWNGYAFEASQKNVDLLKKSIILNNYDISIINKAVYEYTGNIYFGQAGPYGLIQNEMTQGIEWEEIPCICLDDWCKKEDAPKKIDFIKMDIEGSEVSALRGMNKMLKKYNFPPIFVESNSYTLFLQDETQKSLLFTANQIGYVPYILNGNKLLKYDINNFPTILVTDFLLIKDIPENLNISLFETYFQNSDEVTTYIIENLSKDNNDINRHFITSICYALKDFPNYVSNIQIKHLLELVINKNTQDKYLRKYLGWFIE